LTPLGDRVLVKRAPKEVQTASGIYLPDSKKDPNEGDVDKVLLPEYGGSKVTMGDEEVFIFRESDILGKFE
jgi:chaperonin GroES